MKNKSNRFPFPSGNAADWCLCLVSGGTDRVGGQINRNQFEEKMTLSWKQAQNTPKPKACVCILSAWLISNLVKLNGRAEQHVYKILP